MIYYHIHHLMRSGGHFVSDWIAAMCCQTSSTLRYNDALQRLIVDDEKPDFGQFDVVILNWEDLSIGYARRLSKVVARFQDWPDGDEKSLVVLRNPYHLFSSRLEYGRCMLADIGRTAVSIWEEHAQSGFPTIYYDLLVESADYARLVARGLQLKYRKPMRHSKNSSFDGGSPLDRARLHPEAAVNFTDTTRDLSRRYFDNDGPGNDCEAAGAVGEADPDERVCCPGVQ